MQVMFDKCFSFQISASNLINYYNDSYFSYGNTLNKYKFNERLFYFTLSDLNTLIHRNHISV